VIDFTLDNARSILHVRPRSTLAADDFTKLSEVVDPYLEASGGLAGLIVETPGFPGWDGLRAIAAHLRFVREHHKRIKKVAVVTDSAVGDAAAQLGPHFVSAEIRHFAAGEAEAAKQWIANGV